MSKNACAPLVRASVAAALGIALWAPSVTTVLAAETSQTTDDTAKADDLELDEVQITGSRIKRKDLESNSPTVIVGSEVFDNRANMAVEDALNQLPQFAQSLGYSGDIARRSQQGNSSTQFGSLGGNGDPFAPETSGTTVGATNVSLRGLGSNRTLLLLNGKRLVPVNASLAVDTSSIPSSALQRVEIITGGASSVYGADAVSGVVNFILKENYQGADLDVQYGIAEAGDNENLRVSGLIGGNFADGRGNAFMGLEYQERGAAYQKNRDFYRRQWANPYVAAGSNFSLFSFEPATVASSAQSSAAVYAPSQAAVDALYSGFAPGTIARTSQFLVNPDGTVFNPTSAAGATLAQLDDGYQYKVNSQDGSWGENQIDNRMSSPLTRYSLFGASHFDVNDNLRIYTQATFASSNSESLSAPWPTWAESMVAVPHGSDIVASTVGTSAYAVQTRAALGCASTGCTNSQAFPVPTQLATLLDSRGAPASNPCLPFGFSCPIPGASGTNLPFTAMVPLKNITPLVGTENNSLNYQLITGLSGNLPIKDWTFDVYNSYGQSRTLSTGINAMSLNTLRLLMNSPNYGAGLTQDGNVAPPSSTSRSHPTITCTSGLGPALFPSLYPGQTVSQDCIDALVFSPTNVTTMKQDALEGSLQGGLFELPAGELRFAMGAGWRKNVFDYEPSDLNNVENIFDVQVNMKKSVANHATDDVKEVFGELLVPVLQDLPLAKHLNLELGYRYSDYKWAGPISTWKALADWALTPNFRVRGGFQRANRAPNLVELFDPGTSSFAWGPGDQCSAKQSLVGGGFSGAWSANPATNAGGADGAALVRALCSELMGASAAAAYYAGDASSTFGYQYEQFTMQVRSVGNPNLKNEQSDTWTVGFVARSPFSHPLAQFTTTLDWFKIKVNDAIYLNQLLTGTGSPLQACFDPRVNADLAAGDIAAASQNAWCHVVDRDPSTGRVLSGQDVAYLNVGGIKSEGIDFSLNWSAALTDVGLSLPGRISYAANASYMLEDKRQSVTGFPYDDYTGVSTYGAVRWSFTNTFGYYNGPFNASLNWRHYPSMTSPGRWNYRTTGAGDTAQEGVDPYDILGLSFGYSLPGGVSIRAGIDNLLDKDPPLSGKNPGVGGPGTTNYSEGSIASGVYDQLGRSYFVGLKWSL